MKPQNVLPHILFCVTKNFDSFVFIFELNCKKVFTYNHKYCNHFRSAITHVTFATLRYPGQKLLLKHSEIIWRSIYSKTNECIWKTKS